MAKESKKLNLKDKLTDDTLDISLQNLEVVPMKEILEINNKAKKLNLSYNAIEKLPDTFIQLTYIRELDLSKNRLKQLPANFGYMQNLKSLDLLGNQLTTLPSSFAELKSLMWLDLKENPLESELKRAAGDCNNETECRRCATNVKKLISVQAAEEELRQQQKLEQQRKKKLKLEAQEKAKADELKRQKKLEREKKRMEAEQLKQENKEIKKNGAPKKESGASQVLDGNEPSPGLCSMLFRSLLFLSFLLLTCLTVYLVSINFCNRSAIDQKILDSYFESQYVRQAFTFVDKNVCPLVKKYRSPVLDDLVLQLEKLIFN